jgi:FAST kinase domain-containing protein 2
MKFKVPRMEVNDCVSCLKIFIYFGLKVDTSHTIQRLLHQIKEQINDLSPNNIVFLNFLLKKMDQTPLIEALLIALPLVFNLNLSQKMDHNNPKELTDLLFYATNTTLKVSNKSMTNIITALTLHGNILEIDEARSVVWSFTAMRQIEPSFERLFVNCMSIINLNIMKLSFEHMETTLAKIIAKFQSGSYFLYDEEFFNNCARFVIEKDLGYLHASYILKKFNRVNFVSYDLLNYVDKTIVDKHSNLSSCKAAGLLSFSAAFSNAMYRSESWEIIKSLLHENPLMHSNKIELPWIKFAVEMMSIGFHSNILLEKIFSTKFLDEYLSRKENVLDKVQLLLLYQSVKLLIPEYTGPLPEQRFIDEAISVNSSRSSESLKQVLAEAFGGSEFIQSNVVTSIGHCLDFVVSFDKFGAPIALPCKILYYDEIPKSQVNSVAVLFNSRSRYPLNYPEKLRGMFDLKSRTIEALGIKVCNISTVAWNNLPESEKHKYLEREIRFAAQ